jgi:nucleoside-diphosphate-sugar epimerase
MREPDSWVDQVKSVDGAIHLAATFGDDMASADAAILDGLKKLAVHRTSSNRTTFSIVYTGGVWLYGPVGDEIAVEGSPFNPPAEFAFMVEHRRRLFAASQLSACMVHPAMVWDESGGVLEEFIAEAKMGNAPPITGSAETRWPLVHKDDLANLYVRAIEVGEHGFDYHGVAEAGVPVGAIANAISRKYNSPSPVVKTVEEIVDDIGSWAACRAFDQTMDAPNTRDALGWNPKKLDILKALL